MTRKATILSAVALCVVIAAASTVIYETSRPPAGRLITPAAVRAAFAARGMPLREYGAEAAGVQVTKLGPVDAVLHFGPHTERCSPGTGCTTCETEESDEFGYVFVEVMLSEDGAKKLERVANDHRGRAVAFRRIANVVVLPYLRDVPLTCPASTSGTRAQYDATPLIRGALKDLAGTGG